MKRAFVILVFASFLATGGSVRAADVATLAAQQEAQDNLKRLTATLEEYQTTQAAQQKRISDLSAELGRLREELAGKNNQAALTERMYLLEDSVRKVDAARLADNRRIQDALEKLGDAIKKSSAGSAPPRKPPGLSEGGPRPNPPRGTNTGAAADDEGFPYVVVSGDRPDKIAAKYQAEKINVTASAIIKANPSVDWSRLQVGQKLFIPKPKS